MIFPIFAKYGFKNHSHDLLEWTGDGQPPRELLGLTDKPAGHMEPTEQWWPAINCGKVGEWWAIWSIEPDIEAPRGGMVKSNVLLWPIGEIPKVNDLEEFIITLTGKELESPLENDQLYIDSLLNELTSNDQPLIVDSVHLTAHIIKSLWKNLWDEAKINFAIRVSFTPPQSFNNYNHPTFYCVPKSLTNQWFNQQAKIVPPQVFTESSRAVSYLSGKDDLTINELIINCGQRTSNIKFIGRLARAADNLDTFREKNSTTNTISALRSIIACATNLTDALPLKTELLLALKEHFKSNSISIDQIISLSNFSEENVPEENLPKKELLNWTSCNLHQCGPEKFNFIFERCNPTKSRSWWRKSVEDGIKVLLGTTKADNKLIDWLLIEAFTPFAEKFIYKSEDADNRIFRLVKDRSLSFLQLDQLEFMAVSHNFPQLHALVIHQHYSETLLISKQMNSMEDWKEGIPYLVDNLTSSVLLEAIELMELEFTIPLVATRCIKDHSFIEKIDISKKGAYSLWCLQLENGGEFYPASIEKNKFREELYNNLSSALPNNILDTVITELAEYIFALPSRVKFWARFTVDQRKHIADKLVEVISSTPNLSFKLTQEEIELAQSIKVYFNSSSSIAPQLLISCLDIPIVATQHEILRWIFKVNTSAWSHHIKKLGDIILANRWSHIANELYRDTYGFFASKKHLKPAVERSKSLLGFWERTKVDISSGKNTTHDKNIIITRLSTLSAELGYDRLESIWLRAGGSLSSLRSYGSALERWSHAVRLAESGALRGGMKGLLHELLQEYPNNNDLKELNDLI